ncbi:hypothetical protein Bbelb_156370 [Branchiostoma belcheri]|nr:hypothetical protein Bbelb_156370 [Branchiostoma belcheri]
MPNLTLLDLSDNRLRTFPWSSLKNASNICELKLNKNEISKVDAYVDFPESLTYLYLQCNRITTIPETFLHGLKPQKGTFYLRIWKNPFLCDCKIQWIARLRRCVWERRQEGCVNGSPGRDFSCIQAKCNFHPNGVAVILDWLQKNKLISVKQPTLGETLRCDSPKELKGALFRNISLPTCASANDSANSQQTSVSVPVTDNLGVQESEKASAETEPTTLVTNSWEKTTVNSLELSLFWKRLISGILGGALALFVAAFFIRCISHCRKRRQACFNNMASAPTLPTRTGNRLQMIVSVDQSDSTVDGHLQCSPSVHSLCKPDPHVSPKSTATALPLQTVSKMSVSKLVNVDQGQSSNDTLSPSVHSLCKPDPQINPKSTATALPLQTIQWIARLRRCVWEHRDEGCVNASPVRVMRCILAKCNFHPNGVAVILDWLQLDDHPIVKQRTSEEFLRCDSPQELKGNLLRDVSLPTCASPNSSGSLQQTSSTDNAGVHESERVPTETEPPTLVIYSWERTTVRTSEFSLLWKGLTAGILGGALALFVAAFIIRWKKESYRRT